MTGFQESQNPEERESQRRKNRNVMKALKMSVIHVVFFVVCWTPYSVMATWDTIDKETALKVSFITSLVSSGRKDNEKRNMMSLALPLF